MKLKKTDRRFNLYKYGFDSYIEFDTSDWRNYNRYLRCCRKQLGSEFYEFSGKVYTKGNYKCVLQHRSKRQSKRIYFRGEKYHTLLIMVMPTDDENTYYL